MREPKRVRRGVYASAIALSLIAAAAPVVAEHLEAKAYIITDWIAECSANDIPYWDDMIDYWYDEIDDHGWYSKDGFIVNGEMDRDRFCDPDTGLANCADHLSTEDADALMIGLHGSDSGNHWQGSLRKNGGASVNDCRIDAPDGDGVAEEMFLGDVDVEFLHLSSCYSMDDDNLPFTWRMFQDPVDSPVNGLRLHQATGFHGLMWIGGCCDDQYEDFADDAFDVSIKSAWMDNMYVTGINGSATQCPIAYAVGTNSTDCFNRLNTEQYDNIFGDPGNVGYYCYYYYVGCDPSGETAFTP
jgi:hypothetical protein